MKTKSTIILSSVVANEAREIVTNVNTVLTEACEDLNAFLNGEEPTDLAQNTNKASLADAMTGEILKDVSAILQQ